MVDLSSLYPGAGEDAVDLLKRFLVFNPYFRISIEECLSHPFFKKVRKPEKEAEEAKSITFEWEKDHLDRARLRQLFVEEINHYKKARA